VAGKLSPNLPLAPPGKKEKKRKEKKIEVFLLFSPK